MLQLIDEFIERGQLKRKAQSPKLQQHMELLSKLPKPRQRMVMKMLEAALAQSSR